ncbi:MAG TPA: DUF3455 domain-containing protein [Candidatus Koribacter sp.]
MSKALSLLCLLLFSCLPLAQSPPSDVPASLAPPASEKLILQTHASGVQIYTCAKSPDGKYAWTLKGPEAELRDDSGRVVIIHSAGPTWQHKDGSRITGKVAAKSDAPSSDSVAWLLLTADHSQSNAGVLSDVTHVQRIHTEGGQPKGTCSESAAGSESRSHYTADYLFYAPR